jgi:phosphatidate phosphatase APP1
MCRAVQLIVIAVIGSFAASASALQAIVDDGWSSAQGYRFSGRLTEDNHQPAKAGSGAVQSLHRNTRLLFASSAEGKVSWQIDGAQWQSRVDDHGYWELTSNQPLMLSSGWQSIRSDPAASSPAFLLVHDPRNQFGIISDIDDTILVSEVPDKIKLLRNSLTLPPESRQAVPQMAQTYRQLAERNANPAASPIFYVSASPKQLTDGIRRFLQKNGFPQGILMLKEIGDESTDSILDQRAYKRARITAIMHDFPEVKFALVGDDGESDPQIYAEIALRYPEQISGIWIRKVKTNASPLPAGQNDLQQLLGQPSF